MRRSLAVIGVTSALVMGVTVAPHPASAGLLPVAVGDSYTAVHGKLRTLAAPGVLGNDLQLGSGFKAKRVNDVDNGTLDLKDDGSFTYRSKAAFVGTDTFTYRVDGGLLGISNVATVTITVTNDPPVAHPDTYPAVADVDKSVKPPGVLSNDDDADGDTMTIDVVQEPAHGNLDEHDDGSFKYKADKGFSGIDTWRYRVWDGIAWSNTVTVTMTVGSPATPAPTATPTPRPTPRPTPTLTPRPTIGPIITIPPLPSLVPLPTLLATPRPTSAPSAVPTPSPTPRSSPTPVPTARPTDLPGGGALPGGAVGPPPSSPSEGRPGPAGPSAPASAAFAVPVADGGRDLDLDMGALTFDGFEWAVPALVLTVPGILLVIAVLAQALIGLAWLPLTRRWLGGGGRRRPALTSGSIRR